MQRQFAIAALTVGFLAFTSSGVRGAGTNAAEEAAIRKQIAILDQTGGSFSATAHMPDIIFWPGAEKVPVVGDTKPQPTAGGAAGERVPGSQKLKTEVIRIVIAGSRDLAYEYGRSALEFDLKSGKHVALNGGVLGVWQKQGDEWKIAAFFTRPYAQ